MIAHARRDRHAGAWAWFAAWAAATFAAVGAGVEIGWVAALPLVLALALLLVFAASRRGVLGVACGLGVMALAVALVHRHNGNVCWATLNESGCDRSLDWHLWLPIGAVLVVVGVVGQALRLRLSDARP